MTTFRSEDDFEAWAAEKLKCIEKTISLMEQMLETLGEHSTKTYSVKEISRELGLTPNRFKTIYEKYLPDIPAPYRQNRTMPKYNTTDLFYMKKFLANLNK